MPAGRLQRRAGSFYDDTRLTYSPALRPPQMEQTINLSPTENTSFRDSFSASRPRPGRATTKALIRNLRLSFVRPTDPTVTCDPNWPDSTTCP